MTCLSPAERAEIEANLFSGARPAIGDWDAYPWHRHRDKITTGWPNSSQALSIDVFGFLKVCGQPERDTALGAMAARLSVPIGGPWQVSLEVNVGKQLLGEPRSTQLDALASSPGALIAFECKFTEKGGSCSRPGEGECNGRYELEPDNGFKRGGRCALTAKGVRYWDHVPGLFRSIPSDRDHAPCPFASERYQWMRNLAAARALAGSERAWAAAVVFAQGSGLHGAMTDWAAFKRELAPTVRFDAMSYQELLELFADAVVAVDLPLGEWSALRAHVREKISSVVSTCR